MADASIKNQAELIWSEAEFLWAYYKESQYGKTVLLPAVPLRVAFCL
jgi:hypothetical protein